MDESEKWFEVTPMSTDPDDIAAALLAEKIVNSPMFIETYKGTYKRLFREASNGNLVEVWEPVEPQ